MENIWDQRYSRIEYVYGEGPNSYLQQQIALFKPGKILFPCDGEGRNSVYAATLGWNSFAFDLSAKGKKKADALAAKHNTAIHYEVTKMPAVSYREHEFDAVALIFAHFAEPEKTAFLKQLSTYLKPGGAIIFEAYSKEHIRFNSVNPKAGGPSDINMLYSIEEIQDVFARYEIIELKREELEIWEGSLHGGMSSVIRFTATKPNQ